MKNKTDLRSLGIKIGKYPTGPLNNICDVEGVQVGHKTISNKKEKNTGVTVIMPSDNIFTHKFVASSFVLNGAGEVSGLTQINEWGILETPIALTNTMSIGKVSTTLSKWMSKKYKKIWNDRDVVIPVVGECDDSFLNDTSSFFVRRDDVLDAIKDVKSGKFDQGSVGAGTGMICCDFKGGIGSSSRVVNIGGESFTLAVLVLSNFGDMETMRVDGYPIGRILSKTKGNYQRRVDNYGSIIAVIATDLPVSPHQLHRICKRGALGIGRVGSYAAHGSGEIIVGFSTANVIKHSNSKPKYEMDIILDSHLNTVYESTIEAMEEGILNSLTFSDDSRGINKSWVPGIPNDLLEKTYKSFIDLENKLSKEK